VVIDREKILQDAQKLVSKGRLDRAVIEYQKLIKANPSDDRVMLKVADLQTRMRAYEAAVTTYEQVASYYAAQGFSAKATAIYKQIRSLIQQHLPETKGHYGPVVDKLVQLYLEAGLKGDALSTYQEYAAHLQQAGRDAELPAIYRKIVELKEDDLDSRRKLIELLQAQGMTQEADDHLIAYGERLVFIGRVNEGLVALDDVARRRNTDANLARRVADLYLDRNGPGDAMLALTRMQACFLSTKRDIETLRVLARAFTIIGSVPRRSKSRKLMVKIAYDNGDLEIAQALVDELRKDNPKDQELRTLEAMVYPDRAQPVPMPSVDAPQEEAVPASVSLSEDSFEFIEESISELEGEMVAAASTYPPAHGPFINSHPNLPPVPPPAPIPRPMSAMSPMQPPPPPVLPRPAVAPPAPRPVQHTAPTAQVWTIPSSIPPDPNDMELAEAYDDFSPNDDLGELEETTLSRTAKPSPGSLPPPDFFADDDAADAFDDASFNEPSDAPQPDFIVDEGLEEAFEEADFFMGQGLYDDALTLLQDLLPRYPDHPLLIERIHFVSAAKYDQDK